MGLWRTAEDTARPFSRQRDGTGLMSDSILTLRCIRGQARFEGSAPLPSSVGRSRIRPTSPSLQRRTRLSWAPFASGNLSSLGSHLHGRSDLCWWTDRLGRRISRPPLSSKRPSR